MTDRIEREVILPASLQEVWDVVIGPGWLAEEVRLELVPGGDAHFRWGDVAKSGWVEEALAPGTEEQVGGRLIFWWATIDEPASRVELELVPIQGQGTCVRVTESRPLEVLDLVGLPLPPSGGQARGPALAAAC